MANLFFGLPAGIENLLLSPAIVGAGEVEFLNYGDS